MEQDNRTSTPDNWGQIIRKDAKSCFVEIKNDCFHLDKVHLQFVSYDTTLPKGERYTNNINAYIDIPEFLALTQEAASGALHMRMQQYKKERKQEPLYEHLINYELPPEEAKKGFELLTTPTDAVKVMYCFD